MNGKNAKLRIVIWSIVAVILVSLFTGVIPLRRFAYNESLSKINEWTLDCDNLENIKIVESSNYKPNKIDKLKTKEDGNSLEIYRSTNIINNISFGVNRLRKIEVFVPEAYRNNLTIKNSVGDIDIKELDGNINISSNVGDISINKR